MKKEKQSSKKVKTMTTTKPVPKRMQKIFSSLTKFFASINSEAFDVAEDETKDNIIKHQAELVKILKSVSSDKDTVKKQKDPDAPKRAKSSYIFFCIDRRDNLKKKNPDMSAKDTIKELGRIWREDLSEKEKAKYTKLSDDDKLRYDKEMKSYTPPAGFEVDKKKSKDKGPKRALTAYIFFCKEHRSVLKEEKPNLSTKEITTELGKRWKDLSEKDRKPFDKLAAKDKERYLKEKVEDSPPAKSSNKNPKSSTKKVKN